MNNQRRASIRKLIERTDELRGQIDDLHQEIDTIKSEEDEYFDNMPESLQSGEKGEKAQAAIDAIQTAIDVLECIDFDEIVSSLEAATE